MLPSYIDYIFVHLRQKERLRLELSPKFLSTNRPDQTYNSDSHYGYLWRRRRGSGGSSSPPSSTACFKLSIAGQNFGQYIFQTILLSMCILCNLRWLFHFYGQYASLVNSLVSWLFCCIGQCHVIIYLHWAINLRAIYFSNIFKFTGIFKV